jgi:riboflavin synthase
MITNSRKDETMFTGLVEATGLVDSIKPFGEGVMLTVMCKDILEDLSQGDSISIDGACQTVTRFDEQRFSVFVSRVTLSVTTLGSLTKGDSVNLERAMTPASRFGGHIVQGHIDGTGIISSFSQDSTGVECVVETAPEVMKYIAAKGSVAVNGISLTVVSVTSSSFTLYIIPETLSVTTLSQWKKGDQLNVEVDILAKYVEKMLGNGKGNDEESLKSALAQGGFL